MPNFHPFPVEENPNEEEVDGPVFAQFQNFQNGDHTFWMHSISSDTAAGRNVLVGFLCFVVFAVLFVICGILRSNIIYFQCLAYS